MNTVSSPAVRRPELDALRAIAALLVLCMHTTEAFVRYPLARGAETWLYTLSSGLDFGRMGVVLFFVVSGYVVPRSLRRDGLRGAGRFLAQRVVRLYPAFWLSILPGAWSAFWLWGRPFSARELWLNATMLPQTFGARPALWPYWTLRVEWIFYALCILLHVCGLLQSARIRVAIVVLCGLLFVHGSMYEVMASRWFLQGLVRPHMLGFVSLFFYGAWAASGAKPSLAARIYVFSMCVTLPLIGLWMSIQTGADRIELLKLCVAYPTGVALFLGGMRWLGQRKTWLSWLGVRSYGLYLFHAVVLNVLLWCAEQPFGATLRTWPLALDVALVALVATALAHLTHKYVELPGVALGRRWLGPPSAL